MWHFRPTLEQRLALTCCETMQVKASLGELRQVKKKFDVDLCKLGEVRKVKASYAILSGLSRVN